MDEQAIQKITDNIAALADKMDRRFAEQDAKWDKRLDERLDERFDKFALVMFSYMDKRFERVENRLDDLGGKFSDLQSSVDRFSERITRLEQESKAHESHHKRLGL